MIRELEWTQAQLLEDEPSSWSGGSETSSLIELTEYFEPVAGIEPCPTSSSQVATHKALKDSNPAFFQEFWERHESCNTADPDRSSCSLQ